MARCVAFAGRDATLTWKLTPSYAISLGVRNLLDRKPDKHQFAGQTGFLGADYPLNHPSSFDGSSYYLRAIVEY